LTSFLDRVANRECPAEASVLVLWAHGSGLDQRARRAVKPPDAIRPGPDWPLDAKWDRAASLERDSRASAVAGKRR